MYQYDKFTLIDLLNSISSSNPVPGGGSVSAFLLAFSGALVSKVCNVTRGTIIQDNLINSAKLIEGSIILAGKDALGYNRVVKAYRDKVGLDDALYEASLAPLKVAEEGLDFVEITLDTIRRGNPNARTDAIIASLLALLASQGGILNAGVNLKEMAESTLKKNLIIRYDELCNRYLIKEAEVKIELNSFLNYIDKSL